ncbi:helix-turn-helix domain-containing protein [Limisphaera sp. 4302-co]
MPQPAGVELARQVGLQSRYFFLSPTEADGHEVRTLYGGFEQCLPDYRINRASFPHHCLEVIVGGRGAVEAGGRWQTIEKGSLFLYRPGGAWRMRGTGTEGLRKYFVVFDAEGTWARWVGRLAGEPFQFEPLWELVALLEALEREAGHPSAQRQSICDYLLMAILGKLRPQEPRPPTPNPSSWWTCQEAARFIEENYRRLRGLADIAAGVGVDASYLCRLFQRYSGMTPHRCLTRQRMQYAMTLLTREGLNVTAVAEVLGFKNPFHFSRVFKKVHRLPPAPSSAPDRSPAKPGRVPPPCADTGRALLPVHSLAGPCGNRLTSFPPPLLDMAQMIRYQSGSAPEMQYPPTRQDRQPTIRARSANRGLALHAQPPFPSRRHHARPPGLAHGVSVAPAGAPQPTELPASPFATGRSRSAADHQPASVQRLPQPHRKPPVLEQAAERDHKGLKAKESLRHSQITVNLWFTSYEPDNRQSCLNLKKTDDFAVLTSKRTRASQFLYEEAA